jgi:hypothetical protein
MLNFTNRRNQKLVALFLSVVLILGILASCRSNGDSKDAANTGSSDSTSAESTGVPTEPNETGTNTPAVTTVVIPPIIPDKITIEVLEEMNHRNLPKIEYHDDGRIWGVERDLPTKKLSPFPVTNEEEASALLNMYADLFGITEDIDIRFERFEQGRDVNRYYFVQYYNGVRISGNMIGTGITTDIETGDVLSIGSSHLPQIDIETVPRVSLEEAKQIIMTELGIGISEHTYHEPELFIFYDGNFPEIAPELLWRIYTIPTDEMDVAVVRMSAITGKIISKGGNPRSGSSGS